MPDKILLVTGGSRGIGAATARLAAASGFAVAVNYRSDGKAAAQVVEAIRTGGGKAVAIKGDMASESDIAHVFAETDRSLGRLTHFVYNAGITGKNSRFEHVATDTLREVLDINVMGAFLCAREAIRRMSPRNGGAGGAMVMVSSVAAGLGAPGEYVWYAASKGAVDSLTIGLSRELAEEGIRVNAVSPGPIDTEIHEPGRIDRIAPMVPMKRAGTAEEVAQTILFLLSDAASYVTGANLKVSGGR